MNTPMMAFWKYDQYPYLLCGEVVEMNDRGAVRTKEYGAGMFFKPVLIVPLERGKDLREKLLVLKGEKHFAMQEVHDTFEKRLDAFKRNECVTL